MLGGTVVCTLAQPMVWEKSCSCSPSAQACSIFFFFPKLIFWLFGSVLAALLGYSSSQRNLECLSWCVAGWCLCPDPSREEPDPAWTSQELLSLPFIALPIC